MITKERIKQKYDIINEHFNFKDFLGLSALIFGLLLSNSSLETTQEQAKKPIPVEKQTPEKATKVKKKVTKKTVIQSTKKKRQQITAAHKD